jgi:hypothetical protein
LRILFLKNNLFIFTNLQHKTLDKFLLRKYYKEKTSIVPYFGAPHKQKKRRENTKNQKMLEIYIYHREKYTRMPKKSLETG